MIVPEVQGNRLVLPAIVFVNGNWRLSSWWQIFLQKPYEHLGVLITTPNTIAKVISENGPLEPEKVKDIAKRLEKALKPR